jgi:hypothetical protein
MQVIDCFPYNGEVIAEFRMKYLNDVVDEFVIVEARHTHSGMVKEELFVEKYKDRFAPYRSKMTVIIIDKFPDMPFEWEATVPPKFHWISPSSHASWWREMYQRDEIEKYLRGKTTPFVAFCGDADEIPKRDVMDFAKTMYRHFGESPVFIEMQLFYYNFRWTKVTPWCFAFMLNDQWLRTQPLGKREQMGILNEVRASMPRTRFLSNAGWHCSYFASKDDLRRKLGSFAHREYDKSEHKTDAFLLKCISEGKDIADREETEDCVPFVPVDTSMLPEGWETLQRELQELQQ